MKKIFLCRHGQTAWNAERRIQGRTDIDLNDEGRAQAQWLAKFLKQHLDGHARLISSPLKRAIQTAQPIADALQIPVETDVRATEVHTGIFTGKCLPDLKDDQAWQQHLVDPWNVGYGEGGESAQSVRDRIMALIEEQRHDERDLILVTHASPVRHAIMAMLDIPASHLYHLVIGNASASCFEQRELFYKCLFINANHELTP